MLKVTNTLTGQLEDFIPQQPPEVKMYVCGPTVYDHAHIGHGRAYVSYDAMVRYLRFRGFNVSYVRNITDIDDKIIKKANEEGIAFSAVAQKYTDSFLADMDTLGLLRPDHQPRASEVIPEIIAMVQKLIAADYAYESGGDVYFKVKGFSAYGKLSKKNLDDLQVGARVQPGDLKQDALDFALWKAAKPDEPFWESPWGKGRPGWHIECSAMNEKILGETIDIHAGGRDLIFPHHENEIAQSECAHGQMFAKYWLHNGFVTMAKEKMSKSIGNIVQLRQLLKDHHPEALKLYLLWTHYRNPIEFAPERIEETAKCLDRLYRTLLGCRMDDHADMEQTYIDQFASSMDEDFNTAKAIAVCFDLCREINKHRKKADQAAQEAKLARTLLHVAQVLGVLCWSPTDYFGWYEGRYGVEVGKVEVLIAQRDQARRDKDFARADQVRDELSAMGVRLEDTAEGTQWYLQK